MRGLDDLTLESFLVLRQVQDLLADRVAYMVETRCFTDARRYVEAHVGVAVASLTPASMPLEARRAAVHVAVDAATLVARRMLRTA